MVIVTYMRVTGGSLRGRLIKVPRGDTVRPTQDMVRQALFSSLVVHIPGCRFLDLFAGSGAVGLEAWSRGAAVVCWVETEACTVEVLLGNIKTLCGEEAGRTDDQEWRTIQSDVFRFLTGQWGSESYDIVFADPPYDRTKRERWALRLLEELAAGGIVSREGFFVMEQARDEDEAVHPSWDVVTTKVYGGTRLTVYRMRPEKTSGRVQNEER